jgi:hypothetical protein
MRIDRLRASRRGLIGPIRHDGLFQAGAALFGLILFLFWFGCTPPPQDNSGNNDDNGSNTGPDPNAPIDPNGPAPRTGAIVINHACCDLAQVPAEWIVAAKSRLRLWYGHTSHGSQIVSGMEAFNSAPCNLNTDGAVVAGSLSIQETDGDLGHTGDLAWRDSALDQLDRLDNNRNVVVWSWCCGVSDNTVDGIDTYLQAMSQLEADYPGVTFVYMTGHLDGTGTEGNLHARNEQIRAFCQTNGKVLFDFADIESYDPDGNEFLSRYADDGCNYLDHGFQRNWAQQWCAAHPGVCSSCDCAHSQSLNCDRKARAFWWLMARLVGWAG